MSQSNAQVTVIGADTFNGQAIIREWAKVNSSQVRQIQVVVGTKNTEAQRALKSVGVSRIVATDYQSDSKLAQELKNCDCVVICTPVGPEYTKQDAATTLKAVKQARIQNVVFLSMVGVDASNAPETFKWCREIESHVKQCENNVILRLDIPNQYFDFCVPAIQERGNLTLNAGNGRMATLDLADVARVLTHVTRNKSLEATMRGQVYQLTGPTAVDGNTTAQCMRKVANGQMPQNYQNVSRQEIERELNNIYQNVDSHGQQQGGQQQQRGQAGIETRQSAQQQQMGQQMGGKARGRYTIPKTILERPSIDGYKQTIRLFMDYCEMAQQNALSTVTKDVQQLTNNQPTRLEDYFKRESNVYDHLA